MFMIWETFWRHKRSKNKFRRLVCLSANFEMHNLASFFWWVFYFSLIWEHLDPFKKNKRVSLIKKMVLKHLGDEIWPTLCPVKGSIENRGFRFLRFLLFPVSPVSGFFSNRFGFGDSGSVSGFRFGSQVSCYLRRRRCCYKAIRKPLETPLMAKDG